MIRLLPQIVVCLERALDVKALDHGPVFHICRFFFPKQALQFYISVVLICLLNFFSRHRSCVGGASFSLLFQLDSGPFRGTKL